MGKRKEYLQRAGQKKHTAFSTLLL